MAKPKPRAFRINLPKYAKRWGDKHRPFWCPDSSMCTKIAGRYAGEPVGWRVGLQPDRNDLDIVTICNTINDAHDRRYISTNHHGFKPDEAMDLAMDILLACHWVFYTNPEYKTDARRLRDRNRKKEAKAKDTFPESSGLHSNERTEEEK